MKSLFWLILVFAAAAALAVFGRTNEGYALLVYPPWRIEVSLLLAIIAGVVSQRYYPVDWELGRAISILLIAVALSAAALLGPDHALWRIGCVVAYVPILLGLGIVKLSQGRTLLSALRR